MHIDINYTGTDEEKRAKAITDVKDWLGEEKFDYVANLIRITKPPVTRNYFRMCMSMAGIGGFPVEAWADELGIPPEPLPSE